MIGPAALGGLTGAARVVAVAVAIGAVPALVVTAVVTRGDGDARAEIAVETDPVATGSTTAADEPPASPPADPVATGAPTNDDGRDVAILVTGSKPRPTTATTSRPPPTTTGSTATTTGSTSATTAATATTGATVTTVTTGSTTTRPGTDPSTPATVADTRPTTTTRPPTTTAPPTTTTAPPTTTTSPTTAPPTTTTAPPTTTTTAPPVVRMPELVGIAHGDAVARARAVQGELGYFATTETADCNRNTDPARFGLVYDQTPAAGTPLRQGTPITLRYFDTCTRIPAITGLVLDEAHGALRSAGLQASASTTCVPGVGDYVVVSQDPQPGGIVRQGSTVAFSVNSACPR